MHVLKYVVPRSGGAQDNSRLEHLRKASGLDRAMLVREVAGQLTKALDGRPTQREPVVAAVTRWVGKEIAFVGSGKVPAKAATDFFEDEKARAKSFVAFAAGLVGSLLSAVPLDDQATGTFVIKVPLVGLIPDVKDLVDDLVRQILPLHFGVGRLQLGAVLAARVTANLARSSGMSEQQSKERSHRLKFPRTSELSVTECVQTYLGGTVLEELFLSLVEVRIPDRVRREGSLIIAGSGWGKSQLLGSQIAAELARPADQRASLILLDSQADLVEKVRRLKGGSNNIVVLDAADPLAFSMNFFDLGGSLQGLSAVEREVSKLQSIELLEYTISGLFEGAMTGQQTTVCRFLAELMLSLPPGATLETLLSCLEDSEPFEAAMSNLSPIASRFFEREFLVKGFAQTKKGLALRLYAVLSNPVFARIFGAQRNCINLTESFNNGQWVLVNTSRRTLGDACSILGRFVLAMIVKAAMDRATILPEHRRTTLVLIDEAANYMRGESKLGVLMSEGRKYGMATTLAHQSISQAPDDLRAIILANTACKWVGGVSGRDARVLAQELATTPEFLMGQRKSANGATFATYVRSLTGSAVSVEMPFFALDALPAMSASEYATALARNRALVS